MFKTQITLDSCLRRNDRQAFRGNFLPSTDFLRFFLGEAGARRVGVSGQVLTFFYVINTLLHHRAADVQQKPGNEQIRTVAGGPVSVVGKTGELE